jgi:ABC-type phosphate transport system substrate-binding protein
LGDELASSTLRRVLRTKLTATVAAVLTVISAGFLAFAPPASATVYTQITGDGSTFAQPAINQWDSDVASNFGLQASYGGGGSVTGLRDFANGVVNFAASEIPYGVPDSTSNPPPPQGYAYLPDVAGGLTFMYNLVIGDRQVTNLRLSGAAIAGIFTNQITMWNDPTIVADNPGLTMPAIPIIPVVQTAGSGETWQFTQWMAATQGSAWTGYCQAVAISPCTATTTYPVQSGTAMVGQSGDPNVAGYVGLSQSRGAIGFVAYSYALSSGFPVANVLNAAGYYTLPTPGHVGVSLLNAQLNSDGTENLSQVYTDTDPRTYELSFYSYLIVPTDLTKNIRSDAQGLSLGAYGSFLLCQGQQQVDNIGYSALPINLVEDGYTQLQKIPGAQIPNTSGGFIQSCDNPTFSTDGTNTLATNDPMPPACDQQGTVQCATPTSNLLTDMTVTTSPNPPIAGQTTTLTATVTGPGSGLTPAGTVQFSVGNTLIGNPVTLDSNGVASTTETFTAPGPQVVSAQFSPAASSDFGDGFGSITVTVLAPTDVIGTTLTVTVAPAGAFILTAPTTSTITMTVSGGTATGAMNAITISDTRNTYPGWLVTGQASDFTNPTSHPAGDFSGDQLGWAPNDTSLASGAVLGPVITPALPGLGTTAAILASANSGTGFGTSTLGANLTLAIPPLAPSGAYTSTLTLTADPAGV